MSSTPTISDVAKAAGASISAVSFVLNGKADKYRISPATQGRIRAAITQLGFQPSQVAISKAHGEHQPHPIEAPPAAPIAQPVVADIPSLEPEIAIENAPPVPEVDADVSAASAPETDLSSPTPTETVTPTPQPQTVVTPAPEVEADVPAASAPEVDPSSSTPAETVTPTPEPQAVVTPAVIDVEPSAPVDRETVLAVTPPPEPQSLKPEVTIQTPETPHLNPLPPLLRPESRDYEGQAGERTDGIQEGMPDGVAGGQETTAELPAPTPEQSENPPP